MNNISEITFKVKRVNYRNQENKYTIVRAVISKESLGLKISKEVTIKGNFPVVFEGDEFKGKARYLLDECYGHYFQLIGVPETVNPENEKALAEFIKKRVKRLGLKTAKSIVDSFGLDSLRIIKEEYMALTSIKGISEKKAKKIHDELIAHESFENLVVFIQSMGIESHIAVAIYDKYGEMSISRIKLNPYCICNDNTSRNIPFKYAEKIAFNLDKSPTSIERVKIGILEYIEYRVVSFGDLCVYKEMIYNELDKFLQKFGFFKETVIPKDIIKKALDELKVETKIVFEENEKGQVYIYKKLWNVIENKIVYDLKKTLTEFIPPFCEKEQIDKFIEDYEAKYFTLDIKQKEAVYMALLNGISILTGSPGTGKTQTTNTIVQCIKSIKPKARILLLAPTGKASNRMTELTNMEASTIHRGLKLHCFNPGIEVEPLFADFVVIDESSMIDAYIFHKLLSSIEEGTRILFVGDVDQLPSVGAGLILRDMIDSTIIPTTKLTKIFRQAENSDIVKNAHKMIAGKTTKVENGLDISNRPDTNFIFWKDTNTATIRRKIMRSIDRLIDFYKYKASDICILTPMRIGDLGTDELNSLLQEKLNPPAYNKPEFEMSAITKFRLGDKVMQTQNNYDLNVFNGDVGIISKIYSEIEDGVEVAMIDVEYDKKTVTYSEMQFSELELAYAMTIHKSQGSEFKAVIMPIHMTQEQLLNRNLVYTGITRAKEIIVVIGDDEALDYAVEHIEICKRISRLKEKIIKIKTLKAVS